MQEIHKLIIVGSGPAGLTAAIYAARSNLQPLLINGPIPGGQLMGTSLVENWPGIQQILGPMLMTNMQDHAKALGTQFVDETVQGVDFSRQPFTVTTQRKTYAAHAVILALGATPKRLGCPGEDTYWGKGITTCAICDAAFYKNKKVLVVGGGDSAMEDASFLRKFTDQITIVQILDSLSASHAMQQRVLNDPKITILYNTTVSAFEGTDGHLSAARLLNKKTNKTEDIAIDGAFIAIGLTPNTQPLKGQLALNAHGYVTVTQETHTSVPGVFVAGDIADYRYRQAIVAAGAGCKASLDAESYLKSIL